MANPLIQIDDLVREMNNEEFENYKLTQQKVAESQAEADAKIAARESVITKLAKLGLTADEVAAL